MLPSPDLFLFLQADSRLYLPTAPRRRRHHAAVKQRRSSSRSSSIEQQQSRRNNNNKSIGINATSTFSASVSFPFLLPVLAGPGPRRGPLARVPVPAGLLGLGAAQLAADFWARCCPEGAAEAGRGGLCGAALGRQQQRRRSRRRCSRLPSFSFLLLSSSFGEAPPRCCCLCCPVPGPEKRERER